MDRFSEFLETSSSFSKRRYISSSALVDSFKELSASIDADADADADADKNWGDFYSEISSFDEPLKFRWRTSNSSEYKVDGLDEIKAGFESEFDYALSVSVFEYGYKSYAEDVLLAYSQKHGDQVFRWLQDYFLGSFSDKSKVIGILRVLQHMEYERCQPEGPMIALAVLSHEDTEVIENAVRCFENWESSDTLSILESVRVREDWLQQYVAQVICDLREL